MTRKKKPKLAPKPHTPLPWSAYATTHKLPTWSTPDTDRPPTGFLVEPIMVIHGGEKVGGLAVVYAWNWQGNMQANTEFILRACNAHYDLLDACEAMEALLSEPDQVARWTDEDREAVALARAAIARAKGA